MNTFPMPTIDQINQSMVRRKSSLTFLTTLAPLYGVVNGQPLFFRPTALIAHSRILPLLLCISFPKPTLFSKPPARKAYNGPCVIHYPLVLSSTIPSTVLLYFVMNKVQYNHICYTWCLCWIDWDSCPHTPAPPLHLLPHGPLVLKPLLLLLLQSTLVKLLLLNTSSSHLCISFPKAILHYLGQILPHQQ